MGIGFAIPINLVKQVMESIVKNGGVTRGWIGVEPKNLSPAQMDSAGLHSDSKAVLISGVLEGGPASQGGILPGDILLSINQVNIIDVKDLLNRIAQLSPGDKVTIEFYRKKVLLSTQVVIGKRPKQP
jgi:serine protease DegQ